MAPLPDNNTNRLWLDYTSMGIPHSALFRPLGTPTLVDVLQLAEDMGDVLTTKMRSVDSVFGARYSVAGSNFSLPLVWTSKPGLNISPAIWLEDPESAFLSICARSTSSGRRVRWEFFTPLTSGAAWPADNRYNTGEVPSLDAFRNSYALEASGSGTSGVAFGAIDATSVSVYGYLNVAKNAYWQRKQR